MSKTIQIALSPLLIIALLYGLNFFECRLGQFRLYFSCLYFLIVWSLYAYFSYYLICISYTSFVYITWDEIIMKFAAIVSMLTILFYFEKFKVCLRQLSIVDDTLEILGISKEYQQLYNWVIRVIMGWIVLTILINIFDSVWLNYEHFSIVRICVPFVANHLQRVNVFMALIWDIMLGYIGSRFQRINEYIRNLFEKDAKHIRKREKLILIAQRRTGAKECKQYIWILMHVHLQLCLISRELNKVFNIPITLKMACYFLVCVDLSRQIYRTYIDRDTVIKVGQAIDNANETGVILYKLSSDNLDEDLSEQTLQFILQIKQRELKISGMGLFNFGYDFIRKFYLSAMTVLVIIIQMRLPDPGLGIYPIKQPNLKIRWIVYLSILYSLIVWFIYASVHYYIVVLFTWKILFHSNIYIIVTEINIVITIISVIMIFRHQKRFEIILKKLASVDNTLEEMGTPKLYQKMYMRSKLVIIGWIVYSLMVNFFDSPWWLDKKQNAWGFFTAHILNHCSHINAFVDLLFIFILWYIGNRFDKINEHMQCLSVKGKYGFKYTWEKSVISLHRYTLCADNYKTTLWILMHLHLELCRIARELNSIFGMQIALEMSSYFASISTMFYALFIMLTSEHEEQIPMYIWINMIYWTSTLVLRVYIINHIYESVRLKAKKSDKIIHQLTSILQYADICEETYQFTLQTMHHSLEFSAMGLFYFGNSFLRKFCMTVLTYVIIMVQMSVVV